MICVFYKQWNVKMLSVMSDNFHAGIYNFNLKYILHSCINGFIK